VPERSFALEHVRARSRWRVVPVVRGRGHSFQGIELRLEEDTDSAAAAASHWVPRPPFRIAPHEPEFHYDPETMPLLLDGRELQPAQLAECARRVVRGVPFCSARRRADPKSGEMKRRYAFLTAPRQAWVVHAGAEHEKALRAAVPETCTVATELAFEVGSARRAARSVCVASDR